MKEFLESEKTRLNNDLRHLFLACNNTLDIAKIAFHIFLIDCIINLDVILAIHFLHNIYAIQMHAKSDEELISVQLNVISDLMCALKNM